MATFLPVALCVPRQTVANEPDLSCEFQMMGEELRGSENLAQSIVRSSILNCEQGPLSDESDAP